MPIYKQTTEITNIDDLLSSVERDIEEVYFGDKNVFTVWGEYDGTLPAQYTANGDYLADYRVYGSAGGVGDRTENLIGTLETGGISVSDGLPVVNANQKRTKNYEPIISGASYTLINAGASVRIYYYTKNFSFVSSALYTNGTFTVSESNAAYCKLAASNVSWTEDIMLVEGSTAPAEYVPYGYEVDMGVRSVNKFDLTAYTATGYFLTVNNTYYEGAAWRVSGYIPVVAGTYLLTSIVGQYPAYCWYNANKEFISGAQYMVTSGFANRLLTAPQNAAFLRFSYVFDSTNASYNEDKCMVVEGSIPLPYQPYSNTTTQIYIGSEPLGEDEYVDYGEQKVYRMSKGVLTPTDPPVPLPALPTVDGTTITDYAGQSAAPSRFYAKYKRGK